MKYIPKIDTIYNDYIVVSNETSKCGSGTMFKVRCKCGKVEFKTARHLVSSRCKRCKSCSSKLTFLNNINYGFKKSWNGKGVGLISKTWFSSIEYNATRRNIDFNITIQQIWNLAKHQNFKCALTGIDLCFSKSIKKSNPNWDIITASLDRIDSSKGYDINNIQWVHKDINRFKNNYDQETFIKMCKMVTDNQLNKTTLSQDPEEIHSKDKVQRLEGEKS